MINRLVFDHFPFDFLA
jgi:hypothetical protein